MSRTCGVTSCNHPVFGTDKLTKIGYCQQHQYLRTDKKSSTTTRNRQITKVSPKQQGRIRDYTKVRKAFLTIPRNQICLAFLLNVPCKDCTHHAEETHHTKGREGTNMTDPDALSGLCKPCHQYYQVHSAEAIKYGITKTKFGS